MTKRAPSLAGRMAVAVALTVGFYLLALGIAAALLAVPVVEVLVIHRLSLHLTLICLVAGISILWAVFPRAERFEAPGPRLTATEQPRLFAELEGLARASNQAMPAEVYLIDDVNAWVTERSGLLGTGRRRVIGLGLPLLHLLSVDEFRAVLAHEFGHYHGGDTGLGLTIYRTRAGIGRTVGALEGRRSLLAWPFRWYGTAFLRITQAIARRQEFAADRFAAQHAGAAAIAGGLHKVHGAGSVYGAYWHSEALPVLRVGYRPPLQHGYLRFLAAPQVREHVQQSLSAALAESSDPYASHPSLRERLEALEHTGESGGDDGPRAISLLSDPEAAEWSLLHFGRGGGAEALTALGWEEVGERVFVPMWQNLVFEHAGALQTITARDLPDLLANGPAFDQVLHRLNFAREERPKALWLIGAALSFQLHRAGWQVHSLPGEPIVLTHNGLRFEPHAAMQRLSAGGGAAEADLATLEAAGIMDVNLTTGAASIEEMPVP